MNIRQINCGILTINLILGLWIAIYSCKINQNSTPKGHNSSHSVKIVQQKSEDYAAPMLPSIPIAAPPENDVELDVISVPRELASYLSRFSNIATDRSPFTEELLSTIGFTENAVILSRILNKSMSSVIEMERKLAMIEVNSLGEQVLKIQSNSKLLEEIHNSLINELLGISSADTAEFIWMKTKGKILGNLRFQNFTITRHDDAQSGEQLFIIENITEGDPASSILYEPINSSSIHSNYGHLISKFKS